MYIIDDIDTDTRDGAKILEKCLVKFKENRRFATIFGITCVVVSIPAAYSHDAILIACAVFAGLASVCQMISATGYSVTFKIVQYTMTKNNDSVA